MAGRAGRAGTTGAAGIVVLLVTCLLTLLAPAPGRATAALVKWPAAITEAEAVPGPLPGEITVSWTSTGANTRGWIIDASTTPPARGYPDDPDRGWKSTRFTIADSAARSVTLSAADTAAAGAPLGSGRSLILKVRAQNKAGSTERVRSYPRGLAVLVAGAAPAADGDPLRVGSYNLRFAGRDVGELAWSERSPLLAANILTNELDIVGLQEALPAMLRADQRRADTPLLDGLPGRYRLVRASALHRKRPNIPMNARILYDGSRLRLVSGCDDRVEWAPQDGEQPPPAACAVDLVSRPGQGRQVKAAAVARFEVLSGASAGQQFWFASVHAAAGKGRDSELWRARQIRLLVEHLDLLNTEGLPIIVAGDLNSHQTSPDGNDVRVALLDAGYYDTAAAVETAGLGYRTFNGFAPQLPARLGVAPRIDAVLTKGLDGADRFVNVRTEDDPAYPVFPSDHNLVYADLRLPAS